MTMSYILVVNPRILLVAASAYGVSLESLMTATTASAAVMTLFIGLYANVPFGLMPGMGLNAYLAYSVCRALNVTWQQALSSSFVGGSLLALMSFLGITDWILRHTLPDHLKKAITVAIGVFQALIGLETMHLVVSSPATLVQLGDITPDRQNAEMYLGIGGVLLISTLLIVCKWNGSMLIGIVTMALASWVTGLNPAPTDIFGMPAFRHFFQIDFSGWMPGRPEFPGLLAGALVVFFVCLFDVAGVQDGLQQACKLQESNNLGESRQRSKRIIGTCGLATMVGSLFGTSPVIVAVESSAGIMEGARTGLASVVCALLFFASMAFSPVLCAVPHVATAVPLIIVGAFMMTPCKFIEWDNLRVALPTFLVITVVPFTYSIHSGILAGMLMDMYLGGMTRLCGARTDFMDPDHEPAEDMKRFLHSPNISGHPDQNTSVANSKYSSKRSTPLQTPSKCVEEGL